MQAPLCEATDGVVVPEWSNPARAQDHPLVPGQVCLGAFKLPSWFLRFKCIHLAKSRVNILASRVEVILPPFVLAQQGFKLLEVEAQVACVLAGHFHQLGERTPCPFMQRLDQKPPRRVSGNLIDVELWSLARILQPWMALFRAPDLRNLQSPVGNAFQVKLENGTAPAAASFRCPSCGSMPRTAPWRLLKLRRILRRSPIPPSSTIP